MRVIAGSLKGCRLKAPAWEGLRPTSDKLRETLFNILAPRIKGARVLDGYAGTGAIGIEAISRGAAHVTFVERDRRAQALIEENVAHCGITNGYAIIRASVARALDDLATASFDIVVFDPPYERRAEAGGPASSTKDDLEAVMATAARALAANGVLVLEHARRRPPPERAGSLARAREVVSGDSALAFYECPP